MKSPCQVNAKRRLKKCYEICIHFHQQLQVCLRKSISRPEGELHFFIYIVLPFVLFFFILALGIVFFIKRRKGTFQIRGETKFECISRREEQGKYFVTKWFMLEHRFINLPTPSYVTSVWFTGQEKLGARSCRAPAVHLK